MPAVAQYIRVEESDEHEKVGTPASKPEPRKRIADDPRRIFQRLISKTAADRQSAAKQLGWDSAEFSQPDDARLFLTNLDSDEEQEVIIVYSFSGSPPGTVALVFDRQKDGWMQVGSFGYWWHWDSNQAEKLIELREIVSYRRKDILVRTRNGGTGVAETELAIFRMHDGKLYRVFRAVEDSYNTFSGSIVEDERAITYPGEYSSDSYIVVRHTRTKRPLEEDSKRSVRPRPRVSCTAFRWTPQRFTFLADKDASARFCADR
jgi:hypothetical protein